MSSCCNSTSPTKKTVVKLPASWYSVSKFLVNFGQVAAVLLRILTRLLSSFWQVGTQCGFLSIVVDLLYFQFAINRTIVELTGELILSVQAIL